MHGCVHALKGREAPCWHSITISMKNLICSPQLNECLTRLLRPPAKCHCRLSWVDQEHGVCLSDGPAVFKPRVPGVALDLGLSSSSPAMCCLSSLLCVYMHACSLLGMHTHTHTHACTPSRACTHTHTHILHCHSHTLTHILHMHVHAKHMYQYMLTHANHTCVHTNICTYIHNTSHVT